MNCTSGEWITISSLSWHMIRNHHSWINTGPYKLDVVKLIRVLGMTNLGIREVVTSSSSSSDERPYNYRVDLKRMKDNHRQKLLNDCKEMSAPEKALQDLMTSMKQSSSVKSDNTSTSTTINNLSTPATSIASGVESKNQTSTSGGVNDTNKPCGNIQCNGLGSRRCTQCKILYYCSKECQKIHWDLGHKLKCKTRTSIPSIPATTIIS